MKKMILMVLLTASQIISLTACSDRDIEDNSKPVSSAVVSTPSQRNTPMPDTGKPYKLSTAEANSLLSQIEGCWYNLNDMETIKAIGVRDMIVIIKENNKFQIYRNYPDTGVGGGITEVIKEKGGNKYRIKGMGENTQSPMEFIIDLSNDYKSMIATSNVYPDTSEKDVKFIRYSRELEESIELKCLAGDYLDAQNKAYSFKDGGVAIWPDNKTFKFSISKQDRNSSPHIVAYDDKGKETARYSYKLLNDNLEIKNPDNNKTMLDLRGADYSANMEQKAIDLVAAKFKANADYQAESGVTIYKSSIGEIQLYCQGTDDKGRYKVILSISAYPDGSNDPYNEGAREFIVDVKTGHIEEVTQK
ncbi:hypothetical protein [Pseudobacteroides cellulosolvens]|uniref:DUF4362 domain-containing protein n=1 Tax=Pseudobacteroides cellulosolvens ATCC 35603 = DSM 2933 TaxID=398512 RepID=A0A0L6JMT0_9FIRM|nr:hypothetical protein [Pseudobacteroides cellulosolvens]KNY27068.1 hypothetical protein Bccel_2333 [Pseudobacteroides cellulosolvens ATCC 35603 = DSM 2933]